MSLPCIIGNSLSGMHNAHHWNMKSRVEIKNNHSITSSHESILKKLIYNTLYSLVFGFTLGCYSFCLYTSP